MYRINSKNGKVTQKITVSNAQNVDWEELSEDEKYIYIADIGDNAHIREEKQIYRIAKTNILKKHGNIQVKADIIRFTYPPIDNKVINYNAEAIFILNGVIHLFTKDMLKSYHFTIPAKPGETTATYIENFSSNGMVTGATMDKKSGKIILVGYMGFGNRLLWKISNYPQGTFFKGVIQPFSLGAINNTGQVEGVCFGSDHKIYFSNESFLEIKQQLWELSTDQLK